MSNNIFEKYSENKLHGINDPDALIDAILELEKAKKEIQKSINMAEKLLIDSHKEKLDSSIKKKQDRFGTHKISERIDFVVKKNVDWKQDKLKELRAEIGETFEQYIDEKLSVSETKYKSWPDIIKQKFEPARTVSVGKIGIKIKEKKDA